MSTKKQKEQKSQEQSLFDETITFVANLNNEVIKKEPSKLRKLSKRWFIDAFSGMAQGLFVTLIAGLIIKQIGNLIGKTTVIGQLLILIGNVASALTGAGIGAGIAKSLKAPNLVIFAAMVAGLLGAHSSQFISASYKVNNAVLTAGSVVLGKPGDPIGAYVSALIASEIGLLVAGKTKLDIIIIPLTMMIVSVIVSFTLCPPVTYFTNGIGLIINKFTDIEPFSMGILISVVVGILLTMPTSSAAICIAIGIGRVNGIDEGTIAGGAAVVGCCCHMVGFAVQSFKENGFGGLIAQGIGTSMLQIPNIMKKPIIMLPPIIASAICGPLSTVVFKLKCSSAGAGMGTSGLVGVLETITSSKGDISNLSLIFGILLLMFILPAIICIFTTNLLEKKGLIKYGDMKL